MKKILMLMFAFFAMTLTSCRDEAGNPDPGKPVNIAGEVQGTYVGTWTRTNTSDASVAPQSMEGTLSFTQRGDENYVVIVKAECPGLSIDLSAPANINPAYVFFNAISTEFGNYFSGKIYDKKEAQLSFSLTVKEGRKQIIYEYAFTGFKQ